MVKNMRERQQNTAGAKKAVRQVKRSLRAPKSSKTPSVPSPISARPTIPPTMPQEAQVRVQKSKEFRAKFGLA